MAWEQTFTSPNKCSKQNRTEKKCDFAVRNIYIEEEKNKITCKIYLYRERERQTK